MSKVTVYGTWFPTVVFAAEAAEDPKPSREDVLTRAIGFLAEELEKVKAPASGVPPVPSADPLVQP